MNSISDKYGKYLFKCLLDNEEYFFIWGIILENEDEFLLMNDNGKLLFFNSFYDIKQYVIKNSSITELVKWVKEFKNEEIKILSLNIYEEIRQINEISIKNDILWKKISLLIELYEDIIYINKTDFNHDINETLELFKEFYNDNFIWKNKIKRSFKIDKLFSETIKIVSKQIQDCILKID